MGDALGEVMKQVIFSQFVQFPPLPLVPDLSDPAKFNGSSSPTFDLTNTTNLYISSPKGNYRISHKRRPFFKIEKYVIIR